MWARVARGHDLFRKTAVGAVLHRVGVRLSGRGLRHAAGDQESNREISHSISSAAG
jgi:hypothetical protein